MNILYKVIKASVILPVYNVEDYLEECLDCILNQTLKEIEVICVDDGSSDRSLEILINYAQKDERIIVLTQKNKGAGAARNYGLSIAKGKYLSFLDSDDVCDLSLLEKSVERAEEKSADIVIYKVSQFKLDSNNEKEFCKWAYHSENFSQEVFTYKDSPKKIFNSFQNWAWNKLFRRDFIEKNGIKFQEIKRTNDLLFTCTALICAKRITLLDEMLYFYRVGMTNNCQATNYKAPLDFYYAFLALKDFLIAKGIYEDVEESFVNHALGGCLYNLRSIKNNDAIAYLFETLKFEGLERLGIIEFEKRYPWKMLQIREYRHVFSKDILNYLISRNKKLKYQPYIWEKVYRFYKENGLKITIRKIISKLIL